MIYGRRFNLQIDSQIFLTLFSFCTLSINCVIAGKTVHRDLGCECILWNMYLLKIMMASLSVKGLFLIACYDKLYNLFVFADFLLTDTIFQWSVQVIHCLVRGMTRNIQPNKKYPCLTNFSLQFTTISLFKDTLTLCHLTFFFLN